MGWTRPEACHKKPDAQISRNRTRPNDIGEWWHNRDRKVPISFVSMNAGHHVVVIEQSGQVGGVWAYTEEQESDALGQDASRTRVHSSMYASLRTNLPREVMGFLDFPFDRAFGGDARRFCGHAEVQAYLKAFASHFNLMPLVELYTRVESVRALDPSQGTPSTSGPRWRVRTAPADNGSGGVGRGQQGACREFDAVVVCNGHYSEPRLPPVRRPGPGQPPFPGREMHAHNYRRPGPAFEGRTVVVVGAMSSGEDLAREVAEVARRVYLSARAWQNPDWGTTAAQEEPIGARGNVLRRAMLTELHPDGTVSLAAPLHLQAGVMSGGRPVSGGVPCR